MLYTRVRLTKRVMGVLGGRRGCVGTEFRCARITLHRGECEREDGNCTRRSGKYFARAAVRRTLLLQILRFHWYPLFMAATSDSSPAIALGFGRTKLLVIGY